MSNEFYDDLSASLNQAQSITKGEVEPSRQFSYELTDIKLIRGRTGLSQQQFANKLNISSRTLQNWALGIQQVQRLRLCVC